MTKTPIEAFNKPRSLIPKSLIVFFLVSQFLFGFDVGFCACLKKSYRSVFKAFTVVLSVIWIVVVLVPCLTSFDPWNLWYWSVFIEYLSHIIFLSRTKYSVYNLVYNINSISKSSTDIPKFGYHMAAYIVSVFSVKVSFIVIKCLSENNGTCFEKIPSYFYWIYAIPCLGTDVIPATQTIIFAYLRLGVKKLKEYLKNGEVDLSTFRLWYMDLADCYDKIRPLSDYMIIMELMFGVPKMIATLWFMLLCIEENAKWITYMTEMVFVVHLAIQIALSAIVAELVNSEMDAIKLELNQRVLDCEDDIKSAKMNRMLQYIESRPLRHLVWRLVPLDMRLLTALLGLCTAYFIVIIQFTHLYD